MSTKTSALALLAAVFFAGVASTLGVLRVVEHREAVSRTERRGAFARGPEGDRRFRMPRPPGVPGSFMGPAPMILSERLAERLELTEDQRVQLEAVMEERRLTAEGIMEELFPRLRSQMDTLNTEIEAILTEEQVRIFREFSSRAGAGRFRRGGAERGPSPRS